MLKAHGVDNWAGYEIAWQGLREQKNEELQKLVDIREGMTRSLKDMSSSDTQYGALWNERIGIIEKINEIESEM